MTTLPVPLIGRLRLASLGDTRRFAIALAGVLPDRATVGLVGTLGAGKTQFVRFLAAAIGVESQEVCSPTFVLWQTYEGQRVVHHLDAYRLNSAESWDQLGIDEAIEEPGWLLIEWADRVAGQLPADTLWIEFEMTAADQRIVKFFGGDLWRPIIASVAQTHPDPPT
jgi:tRNA threonylcarbamoyladenosine biosynthesis protein TsaE